MDDLTPLRPCLDCGTPVRRTRCLACGAAQARTWRAGRGPQPSSVAKGYDQAWRLLSARARRLQPWCSDCGTPGTDGDPLTVDHSAEAWAAKEAGRPITPDLVAVVHRSCNSRRGAVRSGVTATTRGVTPTPAGLGTTGGPTMSNTRGNTRGRTR